jgi:hypothetical protein
LPKKKSWTEKLHDSKDFPRVEKIPEKMSKRWGVVGTMVIPTPLEVDELMRKVPWGKVTTLNHIRQALARKHGATISCPMCTGIFANIAAHATEEQRQQGSRDTLPYWRTLRQGGVINPKFPGGIDGQRRFLELEGHRIVQRGKAFIVGDYEKHLATL